MPESSRLDDLPPLKHRSLPPKTPPRRDKAKTSSVLPAYHTEFTPQKQKVHMRYASAGHLDKDIKAEKKVDIHTSVREEVLSATFYNVPDLVKNKFPDVVFKKFADPKDMIELVVDPRPVKVNEYESHELSTGSGTNVDEPRLHPTIETDVRSESSSQAAEPTNAQTCHSSEQTTKGKTIPSVDSRPKGSRPKSSTLSDGERAARPQKPLPCRTAESTHEEHGPVADILNDLSGGSHPYYDLNAKKWMDWPQTNKPGAEKSVADFLNKIVAAARLFLNDKKELKRMNTDLVFSARYANTPVKSNSADRKPDIVLVPRVHADAEKSGYWNDIRAIGELKSTTFSLPELTGELTEYARLCFGHQQACRFVLGFSLLNTKMRLWKFDRSGILVSHEFDVHENPLDFLRVIVGLAVGDDYYLGLDPSFTHEDNNDWIMLNDKRYKIKETIHIDSVVRGRGTVALLVEDDAGKLLVVKDQWVDRSRDVKEFAMLGIVKGVKGVASLEDYQLVHFKAGDEIVHDSTEDDRSSAELARKVECSGVETRDHYRILMKPYGQKLEDFRSLKELVSVFRDYMQVIKDLLERDVVHRDISPRNVILVEVEGELLRRGYLIDFDYAIIRSRKTRAQAERTGTLPFMAVDVLMGTIEKHDFYHDVESLFYVLIWICLTQKGPNNLPRPTSEYDFRGSAIFFWCGAEIGNEWAMDRVGLQKSALMLAPGYFESRILDFLPEYFEPLADLLLDLRKIIFPVSEDRRSRVTPKNENGKAQQKPEDLKESRKRKDLDAILALLQTTLDNFPVEEQTSGLTGNQHKDVPSQPRADEIQADVEPRVECVKDQIPDLIRPCDWTDMTGSKHTPNKSTAGTAAVVSLAQTNFANTLTMSRGRKRPLDEEPDAAPVPHSSSSKRSRRSRDGK